MEEFKIIAKTFQGLEEVLAKELIDLGANNVEIGRRMVACTGDKEMLYKANFCTRTAVKVLKPIKEFKATDADEVYEVVKTIEWEDYMDVDNSFLVDSVIFSDDFRHSKFVAYRVKDAIADYWREKTGERPNVGISNPDIRINVHIADNDVTISLDSSGESLHQRGYKTATVTAPINEVLAAGLILLSGWNGECDFIDPFCGSGTIVIEAAPQGGTEYNKSSASNYKSHTLSTRHSLTYTPHFKAEGHQLMLMGRYEYSEGNSSSQNTMTYMLPTTANLELPLAGGLIKDFGSGAGEWRRQNVTFQGHYSYKGKYSLTATLRGDCSTAFGPDRRWGFFPGVSARWNISDEKFMEPVRWLSMLSIRPSFGIVGNAPQAEGLFRSKYSTAGNYMGQTAVVPNNIRLADLRWEKKTSYQIGFDFGFFDNKLNGNVDIYTQTTKDLLNANFRIPSSSGYSSLSNTNVGSMRNNGWEFNINGNQIIKAGKFSMDFNVSFSNNRNKILEMDETLLEAWNGDFNYQNGSYLSRVQINNPLGSIYGFRYLGVYQYSEFSETEVPGISGPNAPVVRNANGDVVYDAKGAPKYMMFDYGGSRDYSFVGGDAIYEDVNNDGQINELDIVYLGSSLPKVTGGFGTKFNYGNWSLNLQFNFRAGVKCINGARMALENMATNNNQSIAINWRWHNEGDITPIPRAATNKTDFKTYNYLGSDRFVEDCSFLRLNYAQLSYSFKPSQLKTLGLSSLRLNLTMNNLFCLTKYSGVDPEIAQAGIHPARDNSQTPRSRSFTFGLNVSF